MGHIAVRLINVRTAEFYIVDGWYEKGGTAAHVLRESDWLALPVSGPSKPEFKDAVRLIEGR